MRALITERANSVKSYRMLRGVTPRAPRGAAAATGHTLAAPRWPSPSHLSLPPHDLEAEQSVIGAIFLSDVTLYGLVIQDGLKPQDLLPRAAPHRLPGDDRPLQRL
jgi:hypothetical protein